MEMSPNIATANTETQYDHSSPQGSSPRALIIYEPKISLVMFGNVRIVEAETTAEKFARLAQEWDRATATISALDDIVAHPAYKQIIQMGPGVVPLILADLRVSPRHWFYALRKITGADPIPAKAAGNVKKMIAAWIKWGRQNQYC